VIALGLAIGGWVLFSVPGLNILGGLLFGLATLGALVASVLLIAYALVHPLLIPCVACESADVFDALSRAYEFLFNRPLRLVLYLVVLIVQGVIVVGIAAALIGLTQMFVTSMAGAWLGEASQAQLFAPDVATEDAGATWVASARLISFWMGLTQMLVGAFAVSYTFCGSTLLYLALRRISDGQDMSEIWVPGLVEGTMAESVGD
jgi:hypothetical protein